jgi:hypothetical protein
MQKGPELVGLGAYMFGSQFKMDAGTRYQRSQYVEVAI